MNETRWYKNNILSNCELLRALCWLEEYIYKQVINEIHTQAVAAAITRYPLSNVVGFRPPKINKHELNLSRKQRSRLAQLRSGYCIITNYYKNIINVDWRGTKNLPTVSLLVM